MLGKENQVVCQVMDEVEHRHQRKMIDDREIEREKTELGGGYRGEGNAPVMDWAVHEINVERIFVEPQGSQGVQSGTICQQSGGHDRGGLSPREGNLPNTLFEKEEKRIQ